MDEKPAILPISDELDQEVNGWNVDAGHLGSQGHEAPQPRVLTQGLPLLTHPGQVE